MSSIATALAEAVPPEPITGIYPEHLEQDAKEIVKLLRSYYDYLNKKGGGQFVVNNLTNIHDIDATSDEYIQLLMNVFAKHIPKASTMDNRLLLKIITDYYATRGSDQSVYLFFRMFYAEVIEIFYPRLQLLDSSGTRSCISGLSKIRDSYYWQEFSYNIKSERSSAEWKKDFLMINHPAGLKLFASVAIEMFAENEWYLQFSNNEDYLIDNEFTWIRKEWEHVLNDGGPARWDWVEYVENPYINDEYDANGMPLLNEDFIPMFDGDNPKDSGEWWKFIDWAKEYIQHSPRFQPDAKHHISHTGVVYQNFNGTSYLDKDQQASLKPRDAKALLDAMNADALKALLLDTTIRWVMYYDLDHQTKSEFQHEYLNNFKFFDDSGALDGYGSFAIHDLYEDSVPIKWKQYPLNPTTNESESLIKTNGVLESAINFGGFSGTAIRQTASIWPITWADITWDETDTAAWPGRVYRLDIVRWLNEPIIKSFRYVQVGRDGTNRWAESRDRSQLIITMDNLKVGSTYRVQLLSMTNLRYTVQEGRNLVVNGDVTGNGATGSDVLRVEFEFTAKETSHYITLSSLNNDGSISYDIVLNALIIHQTHADGVALVNDTNSKSINISGSLATTYTLPDPVFNMEMREIPYDRHNKVFSAIGTNIEEFTGGYAHFMNPQGIKYKATDASLDLSTSPFNTEYNDNQLDNIVHYRDVGNIPSVTLFGSTPGSYYPCAWIEDPDFKNEWE